MGAILGKVATVPSRAEDQHVRSFEACLGRRCPKDSASHF